MPVYHYRGTECDHEFEVRQSFSEDPVAACDDCGKPVRRVIHASPVLFKGSGWYITDSRPTTDPVGGVKDAAKPDGESDSKPAETKKDASEAQPAARKSASEDKPAAKKEPVAAGASKTE